jgi:uncharacterized protein YdaU (DUF1376 family)
VSSSPAFQFYPSDFLGSGKVGAMTPAEVGIYVFLLCLDWSECGFVLNVRRLARYCRASETEFSAAWEIVSECFAERDGRWYSPRLEREREKQAAFREKQAAAGRASAQARFNQRSTVVEPAPNSPSLSLSPAHATSPTTASTARRKAAPRPRTTKPVPPWVTDAVRRWAHWVGVETERDMEDALANAVSLLGEEAVLAAIDVFGEHRKLKIANGDRFIPRLSHFVSDIAQYIPDGLKPDHRPQEAAA